MQAETKYENARHYFLRLYESDFDGREIPEILINRYRKKGSIECQTLDLMKLNQRIEDSHLEVVSMSDKTIQELIENLRGEIPSLYQVCESIALLDMIAAFGHSATISDYCRPELTDCIGIKSGRHPVREKVCQMLSMQRSFRADHRDDRFTSRSSFPMIFMHLSNLVFRSSPGVT
jgi:DNA mismatch repair protein MSH4